MKLLTFKKNEEFVLALKRGSAIVPLKKEIDGMFDLTVATITEFLDEENVIEEEGIEYGPCVPVGKKVICVGLNYKKHAEESKMPIPTSPILFNKFANALAASHESISLPNVAKQYDYEAELGVVIGKKAKNVSTADALNYVFGYCNANDLSARDLQFETSQWLLGKSLDQFCPIGPYVVTKDEISNPNDLDIACYVNGIKKQDSSTKDMIFNVSEIISYVSKYMTLQPGDLILTGTPEGVMLGVPEDEREWLKPGDEMQVVIEGLGVLENKLVN